MDSLNLTPAESLIIVSSMSSGNELMKITLMDLVLRKVLKVEVEERGSKSLNEHYKLIFISEGDCTDFYPKPHEKILIDLISNHSQLELKEFAEKLLNRVDSVKYRDRCIRDNLVDRGLLRRQRKMLLSLIPHTSYVLTDGGLKIKDKIKILLDDAKYLEKWVREDLGKAKAYLSVTGTHILLSDTYSLEDLKKFNKILSQINPETKTSGYFSYYLYTVPQGYLDENKNLNSFDFIDTSVLDSFVSFTDFYNDFDAGSDAATGNREK